MLALEWREWMTRRVTSEYLANRAFYQVQAGALVDNPDQRIASDVRCAPPANYSSVRQTTFALKVGSISLCGMQSQEISTGIARVCLGVYNRDTSVHVHNFNLKCLDAMNLGL